MISRATVLHLRIPFSYYLMPVFLLAWAIQPLEVETWRLVSTFLILHLFLYPASNAFNSYHDKDEGSIGGLENPPPVSKELLHTANLMDMMALIMAYVLSPLFALLLLAYTLASRAYSHPSVRLKKYPLISWVVAGVFQGFVTVWMSFEGLHATGIPMLLEPEVYLPALLSSLMLMGSYPMTQVYQHQEDRQRGDRTLSLLLGIRGTFHFTMLVFTVATAAFVAYFYQQNPWLALAYPLVLSPVLFYFFRWYLRVRKNAQAADFHATMRLNFISATCLIVFFLLSGWLKFPFLWTLF
ncbi:UbiA family prenyltransferase [Shiella aurantiaca]|nr:UbiA family prenyltransferase [Shiella aurantiaca]